MMFHMKYCHSEYSITGLLNLKINVRNVISTAVYFFEKRWAAMLQKVAQDLLTGRRKLLIQIGKTRTLHKWMFDWFIVGYSQNVNRLNLFVHAGLTSWLSEQHHSNKRKHEFRMGCFFSLDRKSTTMLRRKSNHFYFTNRTAGTSQHRQHSIRYSSRLFLVCKVALFCIKSLYRLTKISSVLRFL